MSTYPTRRAFLLSAIVVFLTAASLLAEETLPPLKDGKAPQTFEELWAGYDPCKEPLETEALKDWEQDGVVLRVVRFRIGVFKGQKAMLAGVYGFPKSLAAPIAFRAVADFLDISDRPATVTLVFYSRSDAEIFLANINS